MLIEKLVFQAISSCYFFSYISNHLALEIFNTLCRKEKTKWKLMSTLVSTKHEHNFQLHFVTLSVDCCVPNMPMK